MLALVEVLGDLALVFLTLFLIDIDSHRLHVMSAIHGSVRFEWAWVSTRG